MPYNQVNTIIASTFGVARGLSKLLYSIQTDISISKILSVVLFAGLSALVGLLVKDLYQAIKRRLNK